MGKALFFVEGALFIKVLVKALEAVEEGNRRFSNTCKVPFFFGKTKFFE